MIRIEYKNLPSGVHAEAEAGVGNVIVYLLPGLTPAQRKAALRRLRQEGNRHCGPRLPEGQLWVALAADRLGVAVRSTARAVRLHPFGLLVPALMAGGLLAGFVFASAGGRAPASPLPGSGGNASWQVPNGSPGRGGPAGAPPAAGSVSGENSRSSDGPVVPVPQDVPRQGLRAGLAANAGGGGAPTGLLPAGSSSPATSPPSPRSTSSGSTSSGSTSPGSVSSANAASPAPATSPAPAASSSPAASQTPGVLPAPGGTTETEAPGGTGIGPALTSALPAPPA